MKIVSLAPSNTEILFALGAGSEIVARTTYCDHPKEALKIPKIGDWTNPNLEEIEKLNPDLILTSTIVQEKLAAHLKKLKLPVEHLNPKSLSDVMKNIEKIGELVGRSEVAKNITSHLLSRFSQIRLETEVLSLKPRIYIEEWHKPPFVSGNWVPELVSIAGGQYFPIKSGEPSLKITEEKIQKFDPEVIVLSICGLGKNASVDVIYKREGWRNLSALKSKRIFVIDDSLLNRPGPRLLSGCKEIRQILENSKI